MIQVDIFAFLHLALRFSRSAFADPKKLYSTIFRTGSISGVFILQVACQAFCLSDINMKDAVHALGLTAYDKNNFRVEVQDTDVKEDSIINSKCNHLIVFFPVLATLKANFF